MTQKRQTLTLKPKPRAAQAATGRRPAPAARPAAQQEAPRLRQSYEVKPHLQQDYRPALAPDSLALALLGAANAVARVRAGVNLPQALAEVFNAYQATPQARGAIQDIAYRTMRKLGRSEVLLGLMTAKAPEPPMLSSLLAAALVLLDVPEGEVASYEAFTVVDQAVTAAAAHPDFAHAKAMVNAVLRRFLRERQALLAEALRQPLAQWNYPEWWIDATRAAYPDQWQAILAAGNEHPPLTLRVNRRKTSIEDYLARLAQAGMQADVIGPSALRLSQAVNVAHIPGFAEGLVSVQDAGAQLAAPLLDLADGMRVLDACAAPGGKSGHILELADVDLTAVDCDPKRLARVGENLQRLGLPATLVAGQAQDRDWWDGRQYDRILADVPCTASGIVRRHPDIRWLRRRSDTHQLATLSFKILDNLWQMLRPDGKLLFVTCSLWPQESEAQAAAFAVRHNAIRLDAPGQLLPTIGASRDHDGLFYALFQKSAA
ncbi:16S rRNA (cytosine(967)-C(5))-methyltransferase RsmB [Massilia horti]|uniref:16S rRNA (Cytosine(967)-C(5))-methyltransferase RsmB n=1 Tax=Massilia horti TaxID=2562153 RepID=A0A4Y9SWT2_9BURK|nr:16S rRNA (cytosine(967)-C(5))-methyltransferase RsmB [Massilia horti]TFW29977.1 16S rRNA (cytosine(967)-C(5))-methyltransferase RsmB [Massilia horti]